MDDHIKKITPRRLEEFHQHIQQDFSSLSKRQKEIASLMLSHPEAIALSTLSELEERTNITASAFVRFAKHMGFTGFTELQSLYKHKLEIQSPTYSSRLSALSKAPDKEGLSLTTHAAANSILELEDNIDKQQLADAVSAMQQADMIWLVANGRSSAAIMYLSYMLTKLGIKNQEISNSHHLAFDQLSLVSENDLIIVSSFAPYSDLSIGLVSEAGKANKALLTITDTVVSPIYSKQSLVVNETDIQGFRSICATVSLFQYLAIQAGRQKYENS